MESPFDQPDPLWAETMGSAPGLRLCQADLSAVSETWPRCESAAPEVQWALSLSRSLWVQSWWDRRFLVASFTWSLVALERALRTSASLNEGRHRPMPAVLKSAEEAKLIDPEERSMLEGVFRQLRNPLAHGEHIFALTLGAAEPMIRRAHALVERLQRDVSQPTAHRDGL